MFNPLFATVLVALFTAQEFFRRLSAVALGYNRSFAGAAKALMAGTLT